MKKHRFTFTIAAIVTSYISFTLVALNSGFNESFLQNWLKSWFIAYSLAVPSLIWVSPMVKRWFDDNNIIP